jgi:hypothetical protein
MRRASRGDAPGPGAHVRILALVLTASILLAACATVPSAAGYRAGAAVFGTGSPGAASDARARFRALFCVVANREDPAASDACADLLWLLSDEPAAPAAPPALAPLGPGLRVYVVGGAFSDCFGEASLAFRGGIERLAREGHRVRALPISGRSGAEHNARLVADALAADTLAVSDRVVLIGYSKGMVDILHFLSGHPAQAALVDAVVSVAGPVRGSLLAAEGAWAYDLLLAHAFGSRCDPGDGGVVDSLTPQVRKTWLAAHPLPAGTRFYTLSAFTTRERIARGLLPSWRMLARRDPRNDGQVTIDESLVPGSELLGYANADHWGVAIDIEQALQVIAARRDATPFPRDVLFESIVRLVDADLARAEAATGEQAVARATSSRSRGVQL